MRALAFLCALLLAPIAAVAQPVGTFVQGPAGSAPPAYTGPGDIVTFKAFYGMRAYSSATRGTKVANVCNPSDVVCADVSSDATTGAVANAPVIGGVTCDNTTHICTIKTWYDQSGNACDATQATIANRPVWRVSAIGSIPAASFLGTSSQLLASCAFTQAQPYTDTAVADRTGGSGASVIISSDTHNISLYFDSTAAIGVYAGGTPVLQAATSNAFHSAQGRFNSPTCDTTVDGTTSSAADCGGGAYSADAIRIGDDNATDYMTGYVAETGVSSGAMSSGNITTLTSNQRIYYGF